jgi:hypothetical protein
MWLASSRFFDTLARSHDQLAYVEILHNGQVVATLTGEQMPDPLTGTNVMSIGGGVQVDRTSIRRSGTINFLDVSGQLLPDEVGDLFQYGVTEIRPWVGVRYWDASDAERDYDPRVEMVANGTFETDVTGWVGFGGATNSRDTGVFNSGVASMKVTWATTAALQQAAYVSPTYTGLMPGAAYIGSAWIRCPVGGIRSCLSVNDGVVYAVYSQPVPADGVWHPVTIEAVAQANGNLTFDISNYDAATAGQIANIDDVSFTPMFQTSKPSVQTEYVPLATLVVTNAEGNYPQLSISGFDRMWYLGRFPVPYYLARGTNALDALVALISTFVPGDRLQLNLDDNDQTTPTLMYAEQDDAADAAHALCLIHGHELYVDPMGVFTCVAEQSSEDDPVMTYAPGQFSMLMRPQHKIDASSFYNAVVFTGESAAGTPFRGYAQDDDPNSLTYVGRVGIRVYFESSPLMTSDAMCQLAAKTALKRVLGIQGYFTVPVIPNPALESGDTIRVIDPDQGIDMSLIIDSFPVNMRATDGEQVITCRANVIR